MVDGAPVVDETSGRVRPYRMQARREAMHGTRERIGRAAFALHRDVGPAQATVKAIAERAGVERHTVRRHFPDLIELIRACTDFGMQTTGLPEPDDWHRITDGAELLRVGLGEM